MLQIDDLHRMMKELESLKSIAESQLIELHNNLRDEREQKHIYKQQLDHRVQQVIFKEKLNIHVDLFCFQESLRNLDSIRLTLNAAHTNPENHYLNSCEDDDIENDDFSHVTSSNHQHDQQEQQPVGNLFR